MEMSLPPMSMGRSQKRSRSGRSSLGPSEREPRVASKSSRSPLKTPRGRYQMDSSERDD